MMTGNTGGVTPTMGQKYTWKVEEVVPEMVPISMENMKLLLKIYVAMISTTIVVISFEIFKYKFLEDTNPNNPIQLTL